MDFELVATQKLGGLWKQQFLVARNKIVYLRIVGDGTEYRVMTATADENVGGYRICQAKDRLWMAAAQLARSHNCAEELSLDKQGRHYIRIFMIVQDNGTSDSAFTEEVYDLIKGFFTIYDSLATSEV